MSRRFSGRHCRMLVLGALLLGLLLAAMGTSLAAGTGTLNVVVQYPTAAGPYQALPSVEVFVWDGAPHYLCTDSAGVARFTGLAAGNLFVVSGVSVNLGCTNGEFLQPGTGLKMLQANQSSVPLAAGQSKTIVLKAGAPPADQDGVCGAMLVTQPKGTPGNDVLVGTPGNDVISGGGGRDTIKGLGGDDFLCGGAGRDRLVGGAGNDFLAGERGDDSGGRRGLFGGAGKDALYGGLGNDFTDGGVGTDICVGELTFNCP